MGYEDLASRAVEAVWRATWQGAVFVAAAWIVCRFWKTMPPACRYGLWWLACAQFLLRLASPLPVNLPVVAANAPPASPAPVRPLVADVRRPLLARSEPAVRLADPAASTAFTEANTAPPSFAIPHSKPVPRLAEMPVARPGGIPVGPKPANPFPIWSLLAGVWLVGVALSLGWQGLRAAKTVKLLWGLQRLDDPDVLEILAELDPSARLGVYESDAVPCPLLAGWLRPRIVLPTGLPDRLDPQELRMLLAHELSHARRGDLWLAIVPAVARSIFFFHPFAWLACAEANVACEESCDVEALRLTGGSAAAYARLLLDTAKGNTTLAAVGAAFGFSLLRRRISMLNRSTRSTFARRSSLGLLVIAAVCALPFTVTAQSSTKPHLHKKVVRKQKAKAHKVALKTSKAHPVKVAPHKVITLVTEVVPPPETAPAPAGAFIAEEKALGALMAAPKPLTSTIAVKVAGSTTATGSSQADSVNVRDLGMTQAAPAEVRLYKGVDRTLTINATQNASARSLGLAIASASAPSQIARTVLDLTTEPVNDEDRVISSVEKTPSGGVRVTFRNVDIRTALSNVFDAMGADYMINSQVRKGKVTCTLHSASLEVAIQTIIKATAQKLSCARTEDGVFQIMPEAERGMGGGGGFGGGSGGG